MVSLDDKNHADIFVWGMRKELEKKYRMVNTTPSIPTRSVRKFFAKKKRATSNTYLNWWDEKSNQSMHIKTGVNNLHLMNWLNDER